eukprot:1158527-Pelagomonas_calceolata.AAC.12
MDTQISICAPEVLMLFSDNFDYQSLKPDFITGVRAERDVCVVRIVQGKPGCALAVGEGIDCAKSVYRLNEDTPGML